MKLRYKFFIGGIVGYMAVTQLYKESVVSDAIQRAHDIGGSIVNIGASGIGNIISPTARIPESTKCDIEPTSDDISYCDIRTHLPYKNKEFNVVFAAHVLEHVEPQYVEAAMREFERIGRHTIIVIPPPFMPAFYLAKGHLSQIRKVDEGVLHIMNNSFYNPVVDERYIEYGSTTEVFQ